tara:strand:- start:51 stop:356 length:306 start_codon:yes stop_codon:yes gene_type:complete
MATRNPNNVIEFGKVNFGAPVTVYLITGAVGVDAQVAPGEDLEAALEVAAQKGTIIGLGAESGGAFNLYMENSSWVTADLETAIKATGGVFTGANVADGGL